MLIRKVTIHNYGVFAGTHIIDLSPRTQNGFNRPVVLFEGKNGAGKSTLFRAIRLALHGPLALGRRISQADYDAHLIAYISQVPETIGSSPTSAGITIEFDFVRMGKKSIYRVERSWAKTGKKIIKDVRIFENEVQMDQFDDRQKEEFLRDLISPGIVDIFFFDGEKMKILTEDVSDKAMLSSSFRALFGLDLVHRLQQDIDIYITRKELNNGKDLLQEKLKNLSNGVHQKELERDEVQKTLHQVQECISELEKNICDKEQELAGLGGGFFDQLTKMQTEKQSLQLAIGNHRRDAIEQCGGLLPFSIPNRLLESLVKTLKQEEFLQNEHSASIVLSNKFSETIQPLLSESFWLETGLQLDEFTKRAIVERLSKHLQTILLSEINHELPSFTHNLSKQDSTILLEWIYRVQKEAPSRFRSTMSQLDNLEKKLKAIDGQLSLVPADDVITPLIKQLNSLNQQLGGFQQKATNYIADWQRITNYIEQLDRQLSNTRAEIANIETTDQRIRLAAKSQVVLEKYEKELLISKLNLLETSLLNRFNTLCRKEDLINGIRISQNTFEITLIRNTNDFSRSQLSAGENQVLAIAMMWALRDISGIPIPILIDTPLSRLDIDHRAKMVHYYFPQASHQVILFVTDAEVQQDLISNLLPHISHTYFLDFDDVQNKTNLLEMIPESL